MGKSPSKFTYYKQMDNPIGSRHDIEFPVTGTAEAVTVHRADQLAVKTVALFSSQDGGHMTSALNLLRQCWCEMRSKAVCPHFEQYIVRHGIVVSAMYRSYIYGSSRYQTR